MEKHIWYSFEINYGFFSLLYKITRQQTFTNIWQKFSFIKAVENFSFDLKSFFSGYRKKFLLIKTFLSFAAYGNKGKYLYNKKKCSIWELPSINKEKSKFQHVICNTSASLIFTSVKKMYCYLYKILYDDQGTNYYRLLKT